MCDKLKAQPQSHLHVGMLSAKRLSEAQIRPSGKRNKDIMASCSRHSSEGAPLLTKESGGGNQQTISLILPSKAKSKHLLPFAIRSAGSPKPQHETMLLELEVSHVMEKHLLCLPVTWPKLNGIYLGNSAKPGTTADCTASLPCPPQRKVQFLIF